MYIYILTNIHTNTYVPAHHTDISDSDGLMFLKEVPGGHGFPNLLDFSFSEVVSGIKFVLDHKTKTFTNTTLTMV